MHCQLRSPDQQLYEDDSLYDGIVFGDESVSHPVKQYKGIQFSTLNSLAAWDGYFVSTAESTVW